MNFASKAATQPNQIGKIENYLNLDKMFEEGHIGYCGVVTCHRLGLRRWVTPNERSMVNDRGKLKNLARGTTFEMDGFPSTPPVKSPNRSGLHRDRKAQ